MTSSTSVLLVSSLCKLLSSSLHPFGDDGAEYRQYNNNRRLRRSSSLDFVSQQQRLILESFFFLLVFSLCVLSTTTTTTKRTTNAREIIDDEANECAMTTPVSINADKDDGGKQKEDEKREKNDVLLSSDDTDDENDKDESSRLDEEREEKHQKWEIIAKFPPRVVRETTKGGANASSLLEAWIKAVPRKGKRTLKAVGFGRDTGNGFFKDLAECDFRVEEFRCVEERRSRYIDGGENDESFEKRRRVEIDEEDNDD
jgi:hypothetical protein